MIELHQQLYVTASNIKALHYPLLSAGAPCLSRRECGRNGVLPRPDESRHVVHGPPEQAAGSTIRLVSLHSS